MLISTKQIKGGIAGHLVSGPHLHLNFQQGGDGWHFVSGFDLADDPRFPLISEDPSQESGIIGNLVEVAGIHISSATAFFHSYRDAKGYMMIGKWEDGKVKFGRAKPDGSLISGNAGIATFVGGGYPDIRNVILRFAYRCPLGLSGAMLDKSREFEQAFNRKYRTFAAPVSITTQNEFFVPEGLWAAIDPALYPDLLDLCVYVNGVKYWEGESFSYSPATKKISWKSVEAGFNLNVGQQRVKVSYSAAYTIPPHEL